MYIHIINHDDDPKARMFSPLTANGNTRSNDYQYVVRALHTITGLILREVDHSPALRLSRLAFTKMRSPHFV